MLKLLSVMRANLDMAVKAARNQQGGAVSSVAKAECMSYIELPLLVATTIGQSPSSRTNPIAVKLRLQQAGSRVSESSTS